MYAENGRPSIPPERLLKASLLIALYSVRSERAFCEDSEYNLLFRWFHQDLWSWHGKWSSGDLPTYRSRREYIGGLYEPLLRRLKGEGIAVGAASLNDPTGWPKLDRTLVEITRRLEEATDGEQFQAVGLLGREA